MKKNIYLIITVLLFTGTIGLSQNSNADAVYRKLVKDYTLNEDGSTTLKLYKEHTILSFLALNRLYGETFIVYNPLYQKLKINQSYTIMSDGSKIVTPENAFNEVLPGFAADAPAFNHLREMVVTHTGLELGATIFLDYSIVTKSDFYPFLMGHEIIGESSPVEIYEVIIRVPQGKVLNYKILNLTQQPDRFVEKGKDVYKWIFKSVPPLSNESFREKDLRSIPQLSFSTTSNANLLSWITSSNAFNSGLSSDLKSQLGELVKGENDELKIALKIYNWISSNLETIPVPSIYTGFKPRTNNEVFKSNYATRLEKAVLLADILNYLKMNAQPVFLASSNYFDENIGNIQLFNDVQVQVNTRNYATIYLSPGAKNSGNQKYNISERVVIPINSNNATGILKIEMSENDIEFAGKLDFDPKENTLKGQFEFELQGALNPFFDLFQDTLSFRSLLSGGISGKDITTIKLVKANELETEGILEISKVKAFKEQNGFWIFELPFLKNGFESLPLKTLTEQRGSALELPIIIDEEYEFEVSIPKGFKMENKPIGLKMENDLGELEITFKQNGNKIVIVKSLEIKKKVIYESEYANFKSMINLWNSINYRQLILKGE